MDEPTTKRTPDPTTRRTPEPKPDRVASLPKDRTPADSSSPGLSPAFSPGLSIVQPEDWAVPRGYSNGVLAPAGRRLLSVAGQIGWGPDGTLVEPPLGMDHFVCQFAQALQNVATVVKTAGGTAADVLCLRIYVTDKRRYLQQTRAIGAAYRAVFDGHYPAMSLVQVADLLEEGALVEIEALAALPDA